MPYVITVRIKYYKGFRDYVQKKKRKKKKKHKKNNNTEAEDSFRRQKPMNRSLNYLLHSEQETM